MGVREKCILTASESGEERFKVLLCENKVDGTQNLTYNEKMMPKVIELIIEKMEKLIFDFILI